jgi:hypothetical protein
MRGEECQLRSIVAAIDELGKPSMNYRNDLDAWLTYFKITF